MTCGQLTGLLRSAGFTDIALFGGPDGRPYELGSPRLMLTAHRG
jgi:hypothetical protein